MLKMMMRNIAASSSSYCTSRRWRVQHVSQFVGSPTDVHYEAVKRILRYLKGTLGHGLPIRHSTDSSFLVAFSDADWAGCPNTRRSTNGYCVFLGSNLIS
ncbi:uncharacterized protein LOC110752753 isoform X2 [Prunus avium]|uniref:Uncharacterized protein LOC110752753 isoform X2 n=1 Tax=Prunus avium TaxID=42229 RepID=A0A6P5S6H3_PRUAV|nr:uncharacterized protein LOC110752753 isoform X2 [Prunus avium]